MKKKLLALSILFIPLSMTYGCNNNGNMLTIWVDSKIVDLTKEQVNRFLQENPSCKYTYRVDTVSEQTAATQMIIDVQSGADLYIFAQDQFSRLISAGALASIPTNKEDPSKNLASTVYSRNVASTSDACLHKDTSGNERMYAYPVTSDNGYFLYYDKGSLSEDDVKTVSRILAKCKELTKSSGKNKYFAYSLKDGFWYSAGFFFSRKINKGAEVTYSDPICKSDWTVNPDGTFKEKDDTFCSANGLVAAKCIEQIYTHDNWLDSHNAGDLGANGAIALVSGTWDYKTAQEKLGDNLGITVLPTFTVDGQDYQTGSFSGCKLMGVKPQTDSNRAYWCSQLASYLTDTKCQLERFKKGWGPSNSVALQDKEVQEDPAIQAINAQNVFSVPQGSYPDKWFKFGEQKIVASIKEMHDKAKRNLTDNELMSCLQGYKSQIDELAPDVSQ